MKTIDQMVQEAIESGGIKTKDYQCLTKHEKVEFRNKLIEAKPELLTLSPFRYNPETQSYMDEKRFLEYENEMYTEEALRKLNKPDPQIFE